MAIPKDNLLSSYDYNYPPELIAQEPLEERSASRMILLRPHRPTPQQHITHKKFCNLPEYLAPGDLIVVNNTRVLASRLFAKKKTGGQVEVFLLKRLKPTSALATEQPVWEAMLSPVRGLQPGDSLQLISRGQSIDQKITWPIFIKVVSGSGDTWQVAFQDTKEEQQVLEKVGEVPLPPYIKRPIQINEDKARYQTCFAKQGGAVAAPTAGLHFDSGILTALQERGVQTAEVTLHVGRGTFAPVKVEDVSQHEMHQEYYEIPKETQQSLQQVQKRGGKILAVGTTSLRALEAYATSGQSQGWTQLFIRPGYKFRLVKNLLTNFHQPQSTLLMLVSALTGREFLLKAYDEAIHESYRLFSYGDCMLVEGV